MFPRHRVFISIFILTGSIVFLPFAARPDGRLQGAQAASDPVIAAAGDIACDPASPSFHDGNGSATACRQKYTSNLLVNGNFAAVLPLGDVQYYCGGYQAFLQSYDLSWGRVKDITRPVVGNHEYLTSGGTDCTPANAGAAGYFNYFGAAAGEPGKGYYSYNIGDWHLIALNSNCMDAGGCTPASPQGKWLLADLKANSRWCTLAYWHIPLFSSGGRAELNMREIWQILYNHDVELVLSGHDHIYERFAPQTADGIADPQRGIRQFVVGTGGGNHTSIAAIAPNSELQNANTFGVLKLTLHLSSYDWEFVPEAGGGFTDSGTQECHGEGSPPIPSTPVPTPTIAPTPTGADLRVTIGGTSQGDQWIFNGQSHRLNYPDINSGPVNMSSTNNVSFLASQRVIYEVNGAGASFSEMMALPNNQLNTTYWLPWYNNKGLDTQLRIANASSSTASVHVFIGGEEVPGSPFSIPKGESIRRNFPNVDAGPVKILSNNKVVASQRVIYKVNGIGASFSEMMALPNNQLNTTYWLPWYNNKGLDTQLRIANASSSTASVHVFIGGEEVPGSPFSIPKGESIRKSFPGIDQGPVKILSNSKIVASQRVIYKVKGVGTSFSEMMALPNSQVGTIYWLPWYNSKELDTQLRIANVSSSKASVRVFIGGVEVPGSPFSIPKGESIRKSFPGLNKGPVKILSNNKIVASQRVIYKAAGGADTSFSEMMALPDRQLHTSLWLPWYNNQELDTQLRLAVPQ